MTSKITSKVTSKINNQALPTHHREMTERRASERIKELSVTKPEKG